MKNNFIKTRNVKSFITLMNNIKNCQKNIPKMALIYGEPGLGKTQTILWWATQNDAVYIRCNHLKSGRWLLSEIVEELDEIPFYHSVDLFKQVEARLKQEAKVIIVDEIDYLISSSNAIETLRDLHDKTNVPIILVGMGLANRKLMRYKHLYDRLYEKLKFKPFTKNDVKEILENLSDIKFSDCAIEYIHSQANQFRQIVKFLNKIEQVAKTNGIKEYSAKELRTFIKNDVKNPETCKEIE